MFASLVRITGLVMCIFLLGWAQDSDAATDKQCSNDICFTSVSSLASDKTRTKMLANFELKLFNGREDVSIVGGTVRYKLSPMVKFRSAKPQPDYIAPNGVLVWRLPDVLSGNGWTGKVQVEVLGSDGIVMTNVASASMAGRLLVKNVHQFNFGASSASYPLPESH